MNSYTLKAPGSSYGSLMTYGAAMPPLTMPAPVSVSAPPAPTISAAPAVGTPTVGADPATATQPFDLGASLRGTFTNPNGSLNLQNIGSLAQTIGAFGQLWAGIQANKVAKDSLSFQKGAYETNLANQISTFNMGLEDRAYARANQRGETPEQAQAYIEKHKL